MGARARNATRRPELFGRQLPVAVVAGIAAVPDERNRLPPSVEKRENRKRERERAKKKIVIRKKERKGNNPKEKRIFIFVVVVVDAVSTLLLALVAGSVERLFEEADTAKRTGGLRNKAGVESMEFLEIDC